jgi:transposase
VVEASARAEPFDHQRHTLAAPLRCPVARCAAQIWQLEHHLSPVPAMERSRGLGDRRRDARRDHGRQRPLQHRQHHSPRPCLGSGRKRGTHRRALGRSRGGFTSKLHCLADALGRPLAFHLTVGEAADCKAYDALIDLPERAPDALLADKGYDADAIRADLVKRNIEAVIPGRSNRRVKIAHDRRSTSSATASNACSGTSRSTAPSPPDTTNWPTASSAWSISPPPDTGSNLSTPPSLASWFGASVGIQSASQFWSHFGKLQHDVEQFRNSVDLAERPSTPKQYFGLAGISGAPNTMAK